MSYSTQPNTLSEADLMRTSPWFHLGVLMLAGFALLVGLHATTFHDRRPTAGWSNSVGAALLHAPESLYLLLPIVAGIAVGTLAFRRGGVRSAVGIAIAVMLAMLVLDAGLAPALEHARSRAARESVGVRPMSGDRPTLASESAVRTTLAIARGEIENVQEILPEYPKGHPRMIAVEALTRGAMIFLPFITVGMVLGVGAWVRSRVIFRTPRDEIVARWALAWLIAPATAFVVASWSRSHYEVLFRGEPLWVILVPYVPFFVLAALGWRAALKVARVPPSPVPQSATLANS